MNAIAIIFIGLGILTIAGLLWVLNGMVEFVDAIFSFINPRRGKNGKGLLIASYSIAVFGGVTVITGIITAFLT